MGIRSARESMEELVSFAKMRLASEGYSVHRVEGMNGSKYVARFNGSKGMGSSLRFAGSTNAWVACANHWIENNTDSIDAVVTNSIKNYPTTDENKGSTQFARSPKVKVTVPDIDEEFWNDDYDLL